MGPVTNQNIAAVTIGDTVGSGLGPKNPTVGKDGRALPHANSGFDVDSSNGKPNKRKHKNPPPAPPVSDATRRIVLVGALFALLCAEAWSAPTLFSLAEQAKAPKQLAWLLPAVLDGYAATSIWFGNNVPKGHPVYGPAIANTRLALLITVACNGVFHLLALAGKSLPPWAPIALLVTVTALPIYITDRLVRLYKLATGTADAEPVGATEGADRKAQAPTKPRRPEVPSAPAAANESADVPPPSAPTADQNIDTGADDSADRGADVIDMAAAGAAAKRNIDQWAIEVLPTYRHFVVARRRKPTAPELAEAIEAAGLGALGKSRARDVRAATEKLYDATDWDDDEAEAVNQ